MNIDSKILMKILAGQMKQCIKKTIHLDEISFILSMQGCFNIYKPMYTIFNHTNMTYHIHTSKNKNHMAVSIDVQKTPDRTWHPFIMSKLGIEETCLNTVRCENLRASITPNGENWKQLHWFNTRQRFPLSLLLVNIILEIVARAIGHEKETQRDINGKGRSQIIPACRWYDPIHREPNDSMEWIRDLNLRSWTSTAKETFKKVDEVNDISNKGLISWIYTELKKLNNIRSEMGQGPEQAFYKGWNTNGQQLGEKYSGSSSHQRIASKTILTQYEWLSHTQKKCFLMLVRVWGKWILV